MDNKNIILEYYKKKSPDLKSIEDWILSFDNIFMHLIEKGVDKEDVDGNLMAYIINQTSLPIKEGRLLKFKSYLAHYIMDSYKSTVEPHIIEEVFKETIDVKEEIIPSDETYDVKPEDIPDKQYDLEFLKLIGLEDPE